MIEWWFWWQPQADKRHQLWYPGAHKKLNFSKEAADYFSAPECPTFRPNGQYPTETIGGKTATLKIDLVTPEEFGFSRETMSAGNISLIVCGQVGVKGMMMHTEMAHFFKQIADRLFMFSRLWMRN